MTNAANKTTGSNVHLERHQETGVGGTPRHPGGRQAPGPISQIQVEEEIKTFQKKSNHDEAQLFKKKEQAAQHSDKLQELDERATLSKNNLKDGRSSPRGCRRVGLAIAS
jgi:hypothetical protein